MLKFLLAVANCNECGERQIHKTLTSSAANASLTTPTTAVTMPASLPVKQRRLTLIRTDSVTSDDDDMNTTNRQTRRLKETLDADPRQTSFVP